MRKFHDQRQPTQNIASVAATGRFDRGLGVLTWRQA
jgi:hypothetical protein